MITEKLINDAYEDLHKYKEQLFFHAQALADATTALSMAQAKGLLDGSIEGKNQQLRDAAARELLSELFDDVEVCQITYDTARLNFDLANYAVDKLKLIIRYVETYKEK